MERLPFFQRPLRFQYYNAALILIGANVLVFLLGFVAPSIVSRMALIPAAIIVEKWIWQPFTYMFVHGGTWHLLFNMLGLFFFGFQLERRIGSNEFLLFYLLSGVLAGVFSFVVYWLTGTYNVALVGASGAVFAVLLAFATYFPTATILLFGIIPIRAPILVLGYAALELFNMLSRTGGNVAHMTHLIGFGVAFLYLVVRMRINPITVFRDSSRY
ncbi:MAG: rhomboid family intramembrane serine protease [Spirochaetota bacterium]